jgi:hypothetical protein
VLEYGGVQHILCCVFVLFFFVLCAPMLPDHIFSNFRGGGRGGAPGAPPPGSAPGMPSPFYSFKL